MERICSEENCGRPHLAQGLCSTHYNAARRSGAITCVAPNQVNGGGCAVAECGKPAYGRGHCQAHYEKLRKYGDPLASAPKLTGLPCQTEGCVGRTIARGFCRNCYQRFMRYGSPTGYSERYKMRFDRIIDDQGYAHIYDPDHPNARRGGRVPEHRYVMSKMIGRPLTEGENVHHRNGVKSDNRPTNLELWVVTQPRGQRPEDLVEWAQEILTLYGPGVLAALKLAAPPGNAEAA